MLCHVTLVRTDVSEELSASAIRVTRISELGTLAVMSVLTRGTRRNVPEDAVLQSHRHENLKSYVAKRYTLFACKPAAFDLFSITTANPSFTILIIHIWQGNLMCDCNILI
jgi:hypothetical protein